MILENQPELKKLTPREKIILAEELWADAGDIEIDLPETEEHLRIVEERWQEYLRDPASATPWNEVKQRMRR